MKTRFLLCLLLCLLLTASAAAEGALPVLYLEAARLDYVTPQPGTLRLEGFSTSVTVKYRGTYSATFTGKRNYSLHLKDEGGGQRKASLLGLRWDDDYVLLGGLSDGSRLRAPAGLALWRAMGYPAPGSALCELYFGPYYKGVYALLERPDRKSAGVPAEGALYRVLAASVDGIDLFSAADAGAPAGDTWHNVGLAYGDWQPMEALLKDRSLLDRTAFADYYLFVNLIGATDNITKNLYLCWDGSRFYPMPWDLDAAFGRLYTAAPSDPDAWYGGGLYEALLQDADFQALLRGRWALWRGALSPESVMAYFEAQYALLDACGAWQREAQRFGAYTDSATGLTYAFAPGEELQFIRDYLIRRFALVDAMYGGAP